MCVFIALGANLPGPGGPPRATLEAALARLDAAGVLVARRSRWYRTPAWPDPAEPPFVNGVAALETTLGAGELLRLLHRIEDELGRARTRVNAPRAIDLDLLDYRGLVEAGHAAGAVAGPRPGEIAAPTLPHSRLHRRAFVLVPLAEIAPDWRHPVSRRSVAELIADLPDAAAVVPLV